MATTTKVTFTLDDDTVQKLKNAAERLAKPKSEVVREAIGDFHDRLDRLSDRERRALLRIFDEVVPQLPPRPLATVQRELAELRAARKKGGRRSAEVSAK